MTHMRPDFLASRSPLWMAATTALGVQPSSAASVAQEYTCRPVPTIARSSATSERSCSMSSASLTGATEPACT